jgi:hypothetical protein
MAMLVGEGERGAGPDALSVDLAMARGKVKRFREVRERRCIKVNQKIGTESDVGSWKRIVRAR